MAQPRTTNTPGPLRHILDHGKRMKSAGASEQMIARAFLRMCKEAKTPTGIR